MTVNKELPWTTGCTSLPVLWAIQQENLVKRESLKQLDTLSPCLMPSTGQRSKNDAGELGWRCSTTVLIVSINSSYLPDPSGSSLSSRKNTTCSYDTPSRRTQYRCRSSPGPYQTGTDCHKRLWQLSHWIVLSPGSIRSCKHQLKVPSFPPPSPLHPILLPTLTKYYNNDPDIRNLLSSDRIMNKMMLAALWKKKNPVQHRQTPPVKAKHGSAHASIDTRHVKKMRIAKWNLQSETFCCKSTLRFI